MFCSMFSRSDMKAAIGCRMYYTKQKFQIMRYCLNGHSDEDVLLLSGIFAGKLASRDVCHSCCISNA
jgi:hypothetical protein